VTFNSQVKVREFVEERKRSNERIPSVRRVLDFTPEATASFLKKPNSRVPYNENCSPLRPTRESQESLAVNSFRQPHFN